MPTDRPDVRRTPPARLPRQPQAPQARSREVRLGLAATLGLVVLIVGVPVALALALGNPLPTSGPSKDWLDTEVSSTVVVNVLAVVVWLLWAHFAVCVIAEWRGARRGSGLPGDVPFGGGSQAVARRLVASALLLAGAAALAPTGGAATAVPERPATIASVVDQQASAAATQGRLDQAKQAEAGLQAGAAAERARVTKTYQVQPPDGRRYDSLWDIAERTLGDPLRYKEVFALNKDRVQPDGRTLHDADLIHPGWTLLMPADATGPGVHVATPPPARPAAPAAPEAPGAPAQPDAPVQEQGSAPSVEAGGLGAERGLLGAGLLAAGLVVALSARRGPYARPPGLPVEDRLRLAADAGRSGALDRELRRLADSCAQQQRPLPDVVLAYLGTHDLVLHLSAPAPEAPAPWEVGEQGRVWTLELDPSVEPEPAPDVAAPYPALVNVATVGDHELLVDLEVAPGLVSLLGPGGRDAAVSLAVELATNTWSDGVQVTLVGFGDDLADVAPGAITTAVGLEGVLGDLRVEAEREVAALRALGVDDVLSGRLVRGAARRRPRVLVLSGPPSPDDAALLGALVRSGRTPLAVVTVGSAASTAWPLTVGADGTVDLGVFGVSGRARTLAKEQYEPVLALLREADATRAEMARSVPSLSPRGAADGASDDDPGPIAPAAPHVVEPWALLPALPGVPAALTRAQDYPVAVRLLGPIRVDAPGPLEEAARPLLTEVVVAIALHRPTGGLHDAVLRSMVWPRGVQDEVVEATTAAASAWLGEGRLHRAADGRWVLSDEVLCDADALRTAASQAGGDSELRTLHAGLSLVRGRAFSGAPAGHYRWLAFPTAAARTRVLATAVTRRAAELAGRGGDPAGALSALETGLMLVPDAEALWRDLLRLSPDPDRPAVVARLRAALRGRAEAETDALVEQLVPAASPRIA